MQKSEHSGQSCGFVALLGGDQIHKARSKLHYIYIYVCIIITFLSSPYNMDILLNVYYILLSFKYILAFA